MLITARRHLSIFQHHDGVTGTSKDHVVNDYGSKLVERLLSSQNKRNFPFSRLFGLINICQLVMQQSIAYLFFQENYSVNKQMLILNEEFPSYESLPNRRLFSFENRTISRRTVFIYNPTDQRRVEIVRVLIDTPHVCITSNQQAITECQIDPKWIETKPNTINENLFEVRLLISFCREKEKKYNFSYSSVLIFNRIQSKNTQFI